MPLRIHTFALAATALTALAVLVSPRPATADDHARGAELYQLCAQCHGPQAQGQELALAPSIAGLEEWYLVRQLENFRGGLRGVHPDDLGGLRMYPMSLTLKKDEDIRAVAAYVASLPAVEPAPTVTGGDAQKGAQLYATCQACHGAQGLGNQQMNAPRLVDTNDWYLVSQLQKFKTGVRGANPQNPNAVMMRGFATQLVDEQAIKDVVAHIMTLN